MTPLSVSLARQVTRLVTKGGGWPGGIPVTS